MSNVVDGRNRLEALAQELKEAGSKGTAQKIMNIVKECLYRSHIGVAQGPKKVKRAKKAKPEKAAKAPAKKVAKPKAEKAAAPKKAKTEKPAKVAKPKAEKPAKVAKPKKEKVAKPAPAAAPAALPPDMDFPANV